MGYRSILVQAEANLAFDERIAVAAELARRSGGRLIGIGVHEEFQVMDSGYGYLDGTTIQALHDILQDELRDAEARMRAATTGLPLVWRASLGNPVDTLAAESCAADLVVASRTSGHHSRAAFAPAGDLIMSCGLPVLVLPPGARPLGGGRALVGWKNTLQSRAALTAALPLLQAASEVLLFRVTTKEDVDPAAELERVAERLRLNGVTVTTDLRPRSKNPVAQDLLQTAREAGAEIIVAGAYAHSRASEWVFGGVSDDLLRAADLPVLFGR